MKVLLVHDLLGEQGGAEQIVHSTISLLKEAGHDTLLYAPAKAGPLAGRVFSIKHYLNVLKEIRRFRPDIMHVHNIFRNVSASVLLAARHMKVPIVMTLHDFQIVCPKTSLVNENLLSCEKGFGYHCFYSDCYPRKTFDRTYQGLKAIKLSLHRLIIRKTVRHFFIPSVCLMDWTKRNLGVNNISLLANFVVSGQEPSTKPSQNNTFLFVGKLTEQKGIDVLIKAFAKTQRVFPDARLRVVGDGPEEQTLKNLAADLKVRDNIAFIGKLTNVQVMHEIDDALCVVIPSKYVENCSMVGIEALSRGKIVIASNIGGLPDLIDDRQTGFLVRHDDPDDLSQKLIYLMQNHSLIPEMGPRARDKYFSSFSKQAYSRNLLSAYDRIIHETRDRNA